MAGKKGVDPVSEAAMDIVALEQQREDQAKQVQVDRERVLAEYHQAVGQIKTANMFAEFATISGLVWIRQMRENKGYEAFGTWENFCKSIGYSRQHVEDQLKNLATLGEKFLQTVCGLGVGYRDLRKLRQLSHDGTVTIDAEYMVIGEERIPLDGEHKEELQAAIETLVEQQAAMQQEFEAQKKAFTRVQGDTHKSVTKLQKELDNLTAQAAAKGLTPAEDAFIQKCDNARLTIDGFLNQFDPSINPLPEDATPRTKATLMHTLAWFKRCIIASFDTANDVYGEPEMDDDWVPPHLRIKPETAPEAAATRDCYNCEFKKGMINPAQGIKIPNFSGKCTRPEGLCTPSLPNQDQKRG